MTAAIAVCKAVAQTYIRVIVRGHWKRMNSGGHRAGHCGDGGKRSRRNSGLDALETELEIRFPSSHQSLTDIIGGAQIVLGWDFQSNEFRDAWENADELKWVFWAGAGVDTVLFHELIESDVVLTNGRGVFDRSMAEYVLGFIIAFGKQFPESSRLQTQRVWKHRLNEQLLGKQVLIVGVGSIGREIARVLSAFGLKSERGWAAASRRP